MSVAIFKDRLSAKATLMTSLFLAAVLSVGLGSPRSQTTAACGTPTNGVQICLSSPGSNLEIAFRNVGDRDVALNLGVMMANGKIQLPNRIAIKFTDAQGKRRLFKFGDKRYPGVSGRLDDYVLPLRSGSTYTLQFTLDQLWCQETKEFSLPLPSGNNYLTAQFEGTGAHAVNLDMPGIKLMNFWIGNVESNILAMPVNDNATGQLVGLLSDFHKRLIFGDCLAPRKIDME